MFLPVLLLDAPMRERMFGLGAIDWLAVVYVSLLAITVAYLQWYWGLRVLTPSQTAVYTYLVPVFGVLVGEQPTLFALLGGVVIVLTRGGHRSAPVKIFRNGSPGAAIRRQGR